MSDLIDRQAAIDAVCMEWCGVKHKDCEHPFDVEKDDYYWCDGCETALRTLPDLPSAEPERKKGKWIKHRKDRGHNIADCDQCGGTLQWLDPDERPNFCPDCGADMRQREEQE